MNKRIKTALIYCACTLLASAALTLTARRVAGFAEWYARNIFPIFPYTLGRLFSPLFFSMFELLIVALGAGLLLLLIYTLFMLHKRETRVRLARYARRFIPRLFCALSALLLLYTLACGINYSRAPLAETLGLTQRQFSADELRQLYQILTDEAGQLEPAVSTDEAGYFWLSRQIPPEAEGYFAKREWLPSGQARMAMRRLAARYPVLDVYYPYPKAVFFSTAMSRLHIAGIYSPFTVEANYNRAMPDSNIPFSICHELAHLAGFAREDEANFLAYLACLESGDAPFQYSGLFNALIYVLNALYEVVPVQEYRELYSALPAQVRRDLEQNSAYWQSFAGRAAEISQDVNDYYLKANNQPEGTKSYGRMVDLLLAYYLGK